MVQLNGVAMLDLPEASDERLESAPLSLVVWQMRYPRKLVAAEVGVGLAIQQAVGGPDVWQLDQAQSQLVVALALSQIKGGSAIPTTADTQHGWRLLSNRYLTVDEVRLVEYRTWYEQDLRRLSAS
jgi:hypothetical protein